MSTPREVIPPGTADDPRRRLRPVVQLLVDRGHAPLGPPERLGWRQTPSGDVCSLQGALTLEDWAAVNERFDLPPTLVFEAGCIRDHANWVDIEGAVDVDEDGRAV